MNAAYLLTLKAESSIAHTGNKYPSVPTAVPVHM
jgi:hypothetical protein